MATQGTKLRVGNYTRQPLGVTATMLNPGDWDPAANGDMKFNNAAIAPFFSSEQHEEVHKYRKTAPFTMKFTLGNGDVCSYTGDQCNSWNNAQTEGKLSGPAASKYMLLQNSGTSRGEYRNNLALIERMNMANWMSRVSDDALLSSLLIPGTHESCAVQGNPVSICQTLSLADQLKAGIRFLDIRCRHYKDDLEIHHSSDYQGINFAAVRDACITFLASHSSETIVMLVNQEYKAEGCTESFEATFWKQIRDAVYQPGNETANSWILDDNATPPALGKVRGKIVLLRRFARGASNRTGKPLGIDVTAWPDNQSFEIAKPSYKFVVQDEYKVPVLASIAGKWDKVRNQFDLTAKPKTETIWYLNYTTGSSAGAYPSAVAKGSSPSTGVNQYLFDYLL